MHTNRIAGGWSLIAVGLVTVAIFMIHPSRPDLAPLIGPWGINSITHTIGVGMLPVMLFGCWCLSEWLGLDRPLARFALCANILAVALTAVAGLTSGWITPAGLELGPDFARFGVAINRACDRGYIGFTALAMLANGLSLPATHRALRLFSLPVAFAPLAWLLSGSFDPHVHAMLLLALGQLAWWIAMGRAMLNGELDRATLT